MIKRFGLIAVMLVLTAVMILDFKINEPFLRFFESMVEVDLSARSEMQTQTIEIEEGERLFIEVDESRLNLEPTKKKSLTVTAQSEDAVSVVRSEDGTVLKVLEGSVATVSLPEAILPQVTAYGASVYVSVNVAEIDARSSYLSLTDVKTGKIKAADSYVQLTNSTPEIIETTRCQLEIAQAGGQEGSNHTGCNRDGCQCKLSGTCKGECAELYGESRVRRRSGSYGYRRHPQSEEN